MKNRMIT